MKVQYAAYPTSFVVFVLVVALALCGGCGANGRTGAGLVHQHRPLPPNRAPLTRTIVLRPQRHVAPPEGVRAQLAWIAGGGSSFMSDCSAQISSKPRIEFSRLPYNGLPIGSSARPLLGESFAVCIAGLRSRRLLDLEMIRPDGHVLRAHVPVPPPYGSGSVPATLTAPWYPPLGLANPPGRYVVRAVQGRLRLSAAFVAARPTRPAFRAMLFTGRPGQTFPVEVVGLRAGQHVRLALYRQNASGSGATFVTLLEAAAPPSGEIVYYVRTDARQAPSICYAADVRVDGRALDGSGGVGEFCL